MKCCKKPSNSIFEFEITDNILIPEKGIIPIIPETDIDLLKDKIICEYKQIITQLEKGYKPNLEFLLEEISVVDLENELDKREFIVQYYLNNTK